MRHLHIRKRVSRKLEPYPAQTVWKRFLDNAVYVAGIAGVVMALPQVFLIYIGQDASGVSPISYAGWAVLNIVWILYGITHKERPILITYSLWFVMNVVIGIGSMIY